MTLAGPLLAQHEQMPTIGESFRFGAFRFDVLEISDRRIELVRVSKSLGEPEQEEA